MHDANARAFTKLEKLSCARLIRREKTGDARCGEMARVKSLRRLRGNVKTRKEGEGLDG